MDDPNFSCWGEVPQVMYFETLDTFQSFYKQCDFVMKNILFTTTFDIIQNQIAFYDFVRQSDQKLEDIFNSANLNEYHQLLTSNKQQLGQPSLTKYDNCLNQSLSLKTNLESELLEDYPNLEGKLFFASGILDEGNPSMDLDIDTLRRFKWHILNFDPHVCLALKISLMNQLGFIIFEVNYPNQKPIVVMLDNKPNSSVYSSCKFDFLRIIFKALGEDYISVTRQRKSSGEFLSVAKIGFYVGETFSGFDQNVVFKYSLLQNVHLKYVVRHGSLRCYARRAGDQKHFFFTTFEEGVLRQTVVPFSYLSNETDIENATTNDEFGLKRISTLLEEPIESTILWMKKLAVFVEGDKLYSEIKELKKLKRLERLRFLQGSGAIANASL